MEKATKPEVWLRGQVDGIAPLLQPVAHILMQAKEEINALMADFPDDLLWQKVAGMASPGFHLQHMRGVLDRLFTYASGLMLSDAQLVYLKAEDNPNYKTTAELLDDLNVQIDAFLTALTNVDINALTDFRGVGRTQLPSTVFGLLVHAAEHTMRHTGQLLVTVGILRAGVGVK